MTLRDFGFLLLLGTTLAIGLVVLGHPPQHHVAAAAKFTLRAEAYR